MAILDQFGNACRPTRFAHGASRNGYRGALWSPRNAGVDDLIPASDRKTLAALSRRLVFNQGPAKEAIRQKASYSVGCAWMPVYSGADSDAGAAAVSWLSDVWYPICDVRGGGHDWHEFLEVTSKCMDRDGESFVMLVRGDDGFPLIQHVPSYLVGSQMSVETVKGGRFDGAEICDGIISDRSGRTIGYRVNTDEHGTEWTDVPASELIHVFDSDFPEQKRGYPAFSHALDDMKNSLSSTELETIRQNIISSIFLVEKTENEADMGDPAWTPHIDTTNEKASLSENLAPGIRHIRTSDDIQVVKHENPGDVWESFQDRLLRSAIIGMGWSFSMVWKSPGQGTAERADVVRARKAVEARQKRLRYVAKRAVTWAVAVGDAENLGVTAPASMLRWSFNLPERLTVDDGREARSLQEGVNNGTISESEFQAFKGKSYEQHVREQANDKVTRYRVAREVTASNSEGVSIDPEELGAKVDNANVPPPTETQNDDDQ